MDAAIERADAITELQSILLATSSIEELVDGVAESAARFLAPSSEVTVTLRRSGRMGVVASTGERARRCDEVEYAADAGPCVEAVEAVELVRVPDIGAETRWPEWTATARDAGFRSAAAFPAVAEPGVSVAVNVYSDDRSDWLNGASERGLMYATEAARAIRLSLRVARAAETSDDLRAALASRSVIDQAVGVIMGQNRCTAAEAFAILSSASQHRNLKLRDVAASLIESLTGKPPTAAPQFVDRPS